MPTSATRVVEDYVTLIWKAQEHSESGISSTEIAKKLGSAKSTVSETLRRLNSDGWINYAPYQAISLTEAGQNLAESVVRRHRLLETLLVEKLGYGWDEVHEEADRLEHAISDKLLNRIDALLDYPRADPHGDLIPPYHRDHPDLVRLDRVGSGNTVRLDRVSDDSSKMLRYLAQHQLAPGAVLEDLNYLAELDVLEYQREGKKERVSATVRPHLFVTLLDKECG